jgi:hypothetical protein
MVGNQSIDAAFRLMRADYQREHRTQKNSRPSDSTDKVAWIIRWQLPG